MGYQPLVDQRLPQADLHHFRLTKGLPKTPSTIQLIRRPSAFCIHQIEPGFVIYYLNKNAVGCYDFVRIVKISVNTEQIDFLPRFLLQSQLSCSCCCTVTKKTESLLTVVNSSTVAKNRVQCSCTQQTTKYIILELADFFQVNSNSCLRNFDFFVNLTWSWCPIACVRSDLTKNFKLTSFQFWDWCAKNNPFFSSVNPLSRSYYTDCQKYILPLRNFFANRGITFP